MPFFALALVVAALLVSAVAVADPPVGYGYDKVGYAYVTDVDLGPTNPEIRRHECTYTIAIPEKSLDHLPDGPHRELLKGATPMSFTDPDENDTCYKLEHTWQPLLWDRVRHRVQIAMPPFTGFNFTAWFVTISAALLIVPAVFGVLFGARYKRWRDGRFDRRRERNARKLAAIRERSANKAPAPLPRAEVVDRGDRSSE